MLAAVEDHESLVAAPSHPCTYPGCKRAVLPFATSAALANHRFAAHGIRSSHVESRKRQERRDRERAIEDFRWLAIGITISRAPNRGQHEHIRRRVLYTIWKLAAELELDPAQIALAMLQAFATELRPRDVLGRLNLTPDYAWGTDQVGQYHRPHKVAKSVGHQPGSIPVPLR